MFVTSDGMPAAESRQRGLHEAHGERTEHAPRERERQTDTAVDVRFCRAVVPEAHAEHGVAEKMNGVFRRRCGDAAEQRELPKRADAIRAQREHGAHCKTVHGADGREQKALPHAVLRVA